MYVLSMSVSVKTLQSKVGVILVAISKMGVYRELIDQRVMSNEGKYTATTKLRNSITNSICHFVQVTTFRPKQRRRSRLANSAIFARDLHDFQLALYPRVPNSLASMKMKRVTIRSPQTAIRALVLSLSLPNTVRVQVGPQGGPERPERPRSARKLYRACASFDAPGGGEGVWKVAGSGRQPEPDDCSLVAFLEVEEEVGYEHRRKYDHMQCIVDERGC